MSNIFNYIQSEANTESVITSICALFVSALSLATSVVALNIQHKHNKLSVTPIPEILLSDYEDQLKVCLWNRGPGPMHIKSILARYDDKFSPILIDLMPSLAHNRPWKTFSGDITGRTVMAGKSAPTLLEIEKLEGESDFHLHRDPIRQSLSKITIKIEYTDIYKTKFPAYTKSLDWFGRAK